VRPNALRALKRAKQPILNGWLSIASGYAAEVLGHCGYDALTVDCQHGMMGFDAALQMLQAISSTPAVPLVRPSANDPAEMMRWLDAGAYGLICPMISTPAQAEAFVSACRYPPTGSRSFGPARGLLYGGADYLAHADEAVLTLAMIETAEGLANLHAILATPGLDGIYVGPNDLALALGCAPQAESDDPVMVEAVERIRAACEAAGLISGIFCSGGAGAARRIAEGFDLVTPGNDAMMLKAAAAQALDAARAAR
jgi:4-hydroxy-2-oxoheptanedioate aldolase